MQCNTMGMSPKEFFVLYDLNERFAALLCKGNSSDGEFLPEHHHQLRDLGR